LASHRAAALGRIRRLDAAGCTLLEVVLALTILAAVALLLGATVRVGLRAWEAGQRQAALQQETRAVVELVTEALAAAYPYRGALGGAPERVVLFQGEAEEVRFVTSAAPFALEGSAAPFHALSLGRLPSDRLRLVERMVPTDDPFGDGPEATLSRAVTRFRLQYRDETGLWLDRWDGKAAAGLPTAVRVELELSQLGRANQLIALVVPIALGKVAA
jgi:type II secretory pathway component PulJ